MAKFRLLKEHLSSLVYGTGSNLWASYVFKDYGTKYYMNGKRSLILSGDKLTNNSRVRMANLWKWNEMEQSVITQASLRAFPNTRGRHWFLYSEASASSEVFFSPFISLLTFLHSFPPTFLIKRPYSQYNQFSHKICLEHSFRTNGLKWISTRMEKQTVFSSFSKH